jgi:uncharacterized repeat protein (TIGR03803 family)
MPGQLANWGGAFVITSNFWKTICTVSVICGAMASPAFAQTFNTVASFDGVHGSNPFYVSLVQGRNGNYYGSTKFGGMGVCYFGNGCGAIFEVSPSGMLERLYSFCSHNSCASGEIPLAGLLLAHDGNSYGTSWYGGSSGFPCSQGCGTIYKIAKGTVTTLYNFCAQTNCADGGNPYAALIEGSDGNFYGTTSVYGPFSGGTVFKITPGGQLTTIYTFCQQQFGCLDGEYPNAGVIQSRDGNFYGTTYYGGANGWGTVFKLTPKGALTVLHSFAGTPTEGGYPSAGLVQGADGNFYGTTLHGAANTCFEGCGSVFKITPSGVFTTLHTFAGPEGSLPGGSLIQATDADFYGTTTGGGNNNAGTIFRISPTGMLETLYSFCAQTNCTDGATPWGALLQATNGTFYGTTYGGGNSSCQDCGTIFSLSVGLGPFIALDRIVGKVGQVCGILGQGFTGTTSVSIRGIPANFEVVSDTFLKATIPAGATTGYVTVTTPTGTLTSNMPLRVIQ